MHVADRIKKIVDVYTNMFMHYSFSFCCQMLQRELARRLQGAPAVDIEGVGLLPAELEVVSEV